MALQGRYRFVIDAGDGLAEAQRYDLVVGPGPSFVAEDATGEPATLAVTASYGRWKGLLTGEADFVMSFLLRRIKVDGDVGAIRSRLSDAKPLLDCLRDVPTTFVA
jgi:putative sterol carrier protein